MCVITISRQFGSDGDLIALKVTDALGYEHVNKELIAHVAREANVSEAEVERYDEKGQTPIIHFLKKAIFPKLPGSLVPFWGFGFPYEMSEAVLLYERDIEDVRYLDREEYVGLVQSVVRDLAERGDVVIVGRGAQAILSDREDVLHVRVIAPLESRCRRVMEQRQMEYDSALKLIQKVDRQRACYIKNHYHVDWNDPRLYHLIVNTEKTGVDLAAHLIAETAMKWAPFDSTF